jgi:hypothetical protein
MSKPITIMVVPGTIPWLRRGAGLDSWAERVNSITIIVTDVDTATSALEAYIAAERAARRMHIGNTGYRVACDVLAKIKES